MTDAWICGRKAMASVVVAMCSALLCAATDEFGNTLYRSQHGAPDGWPGCFPDTEEVENKETGEKELRPKYPKWGHPELENYPGSVEHYRTMGQKYNPAFNPFNAASLVKSWQAAELPGIDTNLLEDYEEPIYYLPMYGTAKLTGRKRAPVRVLRFTKASKPLVVKVGRLPRGMYVFRVVAAIETKHCALDPKQVVIRCRISSGPKGEVEQWTRRHRTVDELYQIGEWYFHAWDDREFAVELELGPETEVDLLIHNVDLHDALAGCPKGIIKQGPTMYHPKARQTARAYYAEHNKVDRSWGPNIQVPRQKGMWQGEPLPPDKRQARDETLWNVWPPALVNAQNSGQYGKYDTAKLPKEALDEAGSWKIPYQTRYARNWDRVPLLKNEKLGLTYTLEDYLAGRPLPEPYPYRDCGHGVFLKDKGGYFCPVLAGFGAMIIRSQHGIFYQVSGDQTVGFLPLDYYYRKNLRAARDAAFILCRIALTQPAAITKMRRSIQQVVCRPAQCWGRDPVLRRTFTRYPSHGMLNNIRVYDMLFDFIDGNAELATAVGRFIPWIKTPEDVRAFLDRRLLKLPAREMMQHRMGSSHGTPKMGIQLAVGMGNVEASRPLMEHLFTCTWDYPLPLSGIQDYIVSGTTRDGTTSIGSFSYTCGGSPLLSVADMIGDHIKSGGDKKYNLADLRRYPKPFFGALFNLDARVAGLWPLGVGDVGGLFDYGHWLYAQENAVRTGWKYLKDQRLAWILEHYYGRKDESQQEWDAVEKAAAKQRRNPWMANRSRVLSAWAGILESGTQHDDFRFRRAATVRVGVGWGHSHRDTLDLQLFALGCQMTPDGGQRPGYGRPDCTLTLNHNVVEVDGNGNKDGNWEGHAWIRTLADMPGAPMLHAKAIPPANKQQVRLAERTVALIDVDEGHPATKLPSDFTLKPGTVYDKDVVLPKSYVLDVYRVAGGKRHTYCFHGCAEDEFTVNAVNPRKVPRREKGKHEGDLDVSLLRKYVLEGFQGAGEAPDTVVATWRMGREPYTFTTASGNIDEGQVRTYKCAAPEQRNLKGNYDPTSPRKFTRLHLLGQKGARLLWGRWVSAPYTSNTGQWFTQLHVMHDGEAGRESAFAAVIETYAGTPAIESAQLLDIEDNEADALRAVAVAVTTTNGHHDLLFADGRPEVTRTVSRTADGAALTVSAQFAFVSTDEHGLRQASVTGGREVSVPGLLSIKPTAAEYAGTIQKIDYYGRTFELDASLPARLIGRSFWDVGNEKHGTSLEVTRVKGSRAYFRKGLELVSTRVRAVDPEQGIVTGKLVSIVMGAAEDNRMKPGMTDGLWASNEDLSKWWQCTYTGGTRAEGYTYRLSGRPVTVKDFPINGTLRIWELGATDKAALKTFVSVRRHPVYAGLLELSANVACELALPGASAPNGYEASADRLTWTKLEGRKLAGLWVYGMSEHILGNGRLLLRVAGE